MAKFDQKPQEHGKQSQEMENPKAFPDPSGPAPLLTHAPTVFEGVGGELTEAGHTVGFADLPKPVRSPLNEQLPVVAEWPLSEWQRKFGSKKGFRSGEEE